MLAPPLADFLRARRADCNARFAAARRLWPRLDAADFSLFLRDQLSPLAYRLSPAKPIVVLDRAYDLGLQLVARETRRTVRRHSTRSTPLWTEVFPALAALIATAPRRILGALSNAAHHLATHPMPGRKSGGAGWWRSLRRCSYADELFIVAQVLAWRAGLAHFREPALAAARYLAAGSRAGCP